jgi:hypothetical protein
MRARWAKTGVWFTRVAAGVSLVAAVLSLASAGRVIAQGNGATKLNCDSQPCDAVARGRAAFNDRNLRELGGNGRACADCHMPSETFQLSPAIARARFEALLSKLSNNENADDPLFRPVDADDFRANGDHASDFSNLVDNGLVRVTMPLPVNVRLVDPATGLPSNDPPSISGAPSCPCSTSRSPDPTACCRSGRRVLRESPSWARIPTVRTGKAVINMTRGLPRYKNRRAARCLLTRR